MHDILIVLSTTLRVHSVCCFLTQDSEDADGDGRASSWDSGTNAVDALANALEVREAALRKLNLTTVPFGTALSAIQVHSFD
jgi:hypothetical protein